MGGTSGLDHGSRAALLLAAAAALAVACGRLDGAEGAAGADLHGHEAAPFDAGDLRPGEKERFDGLFSKIICACPRENWTKTLAGCPDGCSDRQKDMVRRAVRTGKTDAEILDEQLRTFGTPKVLAIPDSAMATWFPYAALIALGAIVVALLNRSVGRARARPSGEAPPPPAPTEGQTEEERRIAESVEKDLREMDA